MKELLEQHHEFTNPTGEMPVTFEEFQRIIELELMSTNTMAVDDSQSNPFQHQIESKVADALFFDRSVSYIANKQSYLGASSSKTVLNADSVSQSAAETRIGAFSGQVSSTRESEVFPRPSSKGDHTSISKFNGHPQAAQGAPPSPSTEPLRADELRVASPLQTSSEVPTIAVRGSATTTDSPRAAPALDAAVTAPDPASCPAPAPETAAAVAAANLAAGADSSRLVEIGKTVPEPPPPPPPPAATAIYIPAAALVPPTDFDDLRRMLELELAAGCGSAGDVPVHRPLHSTLNPKPSTAQALSSNP